MKILFLASECWPLVKIGGLADVVSSLSRALSRQGKEVSVVIPFYETLDPEKKAQPLKRDLSVFFKGKKRSFSVWKASLFEAGVPVYLIRKKRYFRESVYPSPDASPSGSLEEAERFLFFSRAALEVASHLGADLLHCHDWQTALVPFLVEKQNLCFKTLLTIHNLGYQGLYPVRQAEEMLGLELPGRGKINCLKTGIEHAHLLNTVSPTYAKEILTPEYGSGLEEVLKKRKEDLFGILNGLDEKIWNPETDPHLLENYSSRSLEGRKENKEFLLKEHFSSPDPSPPLLGMVSRLAEQKGIRLVREILPELVENDLYFLLLGKGAEKYEKFLTRFSRRHPARFQARIEFNEELAHRIYAGSDIYLTPSFYEPCGLGQQIAMKYGAVPLGRATGGIKDTIDPTRLGLLRQKAGTGFLFKKAEPEPLKEAIKKALRVYGEKEEVWAEIQRKGMKKDFSWPTSAQKYIGLYEKLS